MARVPAFSGDENAALRMMASDLVLALGSQGAVALELGISQGAFSQFLRGKIGISADTGERLRDVAIGRDLTATTRKRLDRLLALAGSGADTPASSLRDASTEDLLAELVRRGLKVRLMP